MFMCILSYVSNPSVHSFVRMMIGETGRNFAAGMSGGLAFIYDPADTFVNKCNLGMVSVSRLSPEHATPTGKLIHMNILYACMDV